MKLNFGAGTKFTDLSHPARGAWIEMIIPTSLIKYDTVAPRKGCVD